MTIRLQTYLRDQGYASRRDCEKLITDGRVLVNGTVVTTLGTKVDPAVDRVTVSDATAPGQDQKIYIALYKPRGVVSSCEHTPFEKKIILDLVDLPIPLFPVGRLDKESEGLILLTNDGLFANQLTHPRYAHEKEYLVTTRQPLPSTALDKLRHGVRIVTEQGPFTTAPTTVTAVAPHKLKIILREGKKHQIRLMIEQVGGQVLFLKRLRIGKLKLGNLQLGEWRYITPEEVL